MTDQAGDVWGFINKVAEQKMRRDSNLQQLLVGKRQDALEDDNVGPVHRFLWRGTGKMYIRKKKKTYKWNAVNLNVTLLAGLNYMHLKL